MKRIRMFMGLGLAGAIVVAAAGWALAESPSEAVKANEPSDTVVARDGAVSPAVTIQADRTSLADGGTIVVTGTAPAGRPVYLEVWSERKVRAARFDAEVDKATGKRPYVLYMTEDVPAYYRLFVPKDRAGTLQKIQREGSKWSFSQALKDLGAGGAYSVPAAAKIERYQASLLGGVVGSRGKLLPPLDEPASRKRSMQLMKAKFRSPGKLLGADVEVMPGGTYRAVIQLGAGLAPGQYSVVAAVDEKTRSRPLIFQNSIAFPHVYFGNAGASINLLWPFLLALVISIFGVMMGAGGGFILNPLLVSLWPLPHTVVAGTVMPTVLFSQGSGIYNYSKIKFISWKLGIAIGVATIAGGFVGPKLTEMVTLEQYKFVFGWILIVLAGLMLWQTTPGYLAKNKKEQAILKEFKKRAEDAAARQGDDAAGRKAA